MNEPHAFALALLSRGLSVVATAYADWLFRRISDGAEAGFDFLRDLKRFARWLVRMIAERLGGYRRPSYHDQEELEPELFGGR
jgi:hypothetical protein